MGRALNWFKKLLTPEPCKHEFYEENRWVEDNTPMVFFRCLECSFTDRGHVHGPTEGWEGTTLKVAPWHRTA